MGSLRSATRIERNVMTALQTAGHQVYVWTVNAEADLETVLDQRVDGIITDRPRFVLDRLGVS